MCARYRRYDVEQTYFVIVDPMAIKNHNPLLRAIDYFVEARIPFEHISEKSK